MAVRALLQGVSMPSKHFVPIGVLMAACGGSEDPLAVDANITQWANSSSAMGAYEAGRESIAIFHGEGGFPDPACPVVIADADGASITGDCVDSDGESWVGSATVTLTGTTVRLELDGFGSDNVFRPPTDGFVELVEVGVDEHTFDVDVTSRGGIVTTILYEGSVIGGYDGPTTWNGSGTVRKNGDFFDGGTITVETVDQVRDNDQCPGEGFSGTTTMSSLEHEVVITYDGDTDCDPDHSARWSRDGVDQGVIAGITCSSGGASGFGMLLIGLGFVMRRRRRGALMTRGCRPCPAR
jgi:MYXO-CTERM domain-containing protein